MAKQSYRIPHGLDKSRLDMQISLKSSNGVGVRPLPLRFILTVLVAAFIGAGIIVTGPVREAGPVFMAVFAVVWICICVFLLRLDKTGEMAFERLPVAANYIQKSKRKCSTKLSQPCGPFMLATNIEGCDEERGMLYFNDGDVGFVYRVVGSASVMLFDEDRDAIINRVDNFYRKMETEYEMIYITTREPQDVRRQIAAMDERIAGLRPDDHELRALLETERAYLSEYVGDEFKSLHQYLVIKAENLELLQRGQQLLRAEVENSLLMYKRCVAVFDDDMRLFLRSVFGPAGAGAGRAEMGSQMDSQRNGQDVFADEHRR